MRILITGMGQIGETIVKTLRNEGHEVVVIDRSEKTIEQMVDQYDVMGITGNGISYDILMSAGVEKCDLFIAVTDSDEANILACLIAKNLGCKYTIARVREYEYSKQINKMKDDLGITMTFNPEALTAEEILRITNFPEALKIDSFAGDCADIVELFIPEGCPIVGMPLYKVSKELGVNCLISAVQRNDEVIIPTGSFIFEANDKIHITSDKYNSRLLLTKLGLEENKAKNILIVGGGIIGLYLAEDLIKNNYNVKIIEENLERCKELSELLPKAVVIYGDGADQRLLDEEGISEADIVICLTPSDEENIIISMYASKVSDCKVISKIENPSYAKLMQSIELSSVVSPREVSSSLIVTYARALSNSSGSNVKTLYKLVDGKVEALEFIANDGDFIDVQLKDLKIKKNILIAGIVRNNSFIIPTGLTSIKKGDSVLVVTKDEGLNDLNDILV